jgi:hypothetical protein
LDGDQPAGTRSALMHVKVRAAISAEMRYGVRSITWTLPLPLERQPFDR